MTLLSQFLTTLEFLIAVGLRLLIFEGFSTPYVLIRDPMVIYFGKALKFLTLIFDQFVSDKVFFVPYYFARCDATHFTLVTYSDGKFITELPLFIFLIIVKAA